MPRLPWLLTVIALVALTPTAWAADATLPGGASPDALAGTIRGYLIRYLPDPLHEESKGWGDTKRVANGVKWTGKRINIKPEIQYKEKNDGRWKKLRVTADNLPDTLIFDLRNVQQPERGRLTFDVFISFDVKVHYHQMNWESGIKLYDGTADAKLRIKALISCEATTRFEKVPGSFIPDLVFRLRVVQANVSYDNFKLTHIAGVGGELAQMLGDTVKGATREWFPHVERKFLAKANEAIVKAGDSKEVRVSLGKWLK